MSIEIERLLARFSERDLRRLVAADLERALRGLAALNHSDQKRWLAQCAVATHGTGLLRHKNARKGLFLLVPEAHLRDITDQLCGRSYAKPEDNALALAQLPWQPGSAIANVVASYFDIPYTFLPRATNEAPTIDIIELFRELPGLHDYQEEVVRAIAAQVVKPYSALLVQMPTGSGKTRTVVESLARISGESLRRTSLIWLAHAEELCEQAAESFQRVWSHKAASPTRIVRLFGRHEPPPYAIPGSIVIGSLQKLYARLRGPESALSKALRSTARVVVVDEAHRAIAPSFRHVIEALTAQGATLVGLTATPGRTATQSNETRKLVQLFGGNLVTPEREGDLVTKLQEDGVLARLHRRLLDTALRVQPNAEEITALQLGFDFGSSVLHVLATNEERNKLILHTVEQEVGSGRPTIVFACTVRHARTLAAALNLRGIASAHVDGEMDRADRQYAVEKFRTAEVDVLTNFGVLTTGFDAPRTRTVVIARPTTSAVLYGQMVGRALRGPKMGGNEDAWVIDVRDNIARFGDVSDIYNAFERFWGR